MATFSHERLARITRTVPPYRGTQNRFPLFNRRQNTKYFLSREENGQTVFDIVYGQRWTTVPLSKEDVDLLPPGKRSNVTHTPSGTYIQYVASPNIMATVRPGATVEGELEFNAKQYGQGDRMFLSSGVWGWFQTNSRMGGMVYRARANDGVRIQPIYRGMRVNAVSMKPIEPYEVVLRRVDRKASKGLMSRYEHLLKVSKVMLKSMTLGDAVSVAEQLVNDVDPQMYLRKYGYDEDMKRRALGLIDSAPLDAFLLLCMAYDLRQLKYMAHNPGVNRYWHGSKETNAHDWMYESVKRHLVKDLYNENPGIFKEKVYPYGVYPYGEKFPQSDWGVKIIVNGQEKEQYT